MARTTAADILAILDTDAGEVEINPFMATANLIVTARLASAGLDSDLMAQIEKYLAAHLFRAKEPEVKTESVGGASASYNLPSATAGGLQTTFYGQQVLLLDTSGKMAAAGRQVASMETLDFIDGGT